MRMRTVSVVLGALLALSACGEEDGSTSDGRESPSPDTRPSSTTTPDPKPGMTAPGAELALGDTATVPVRSFKDPIGGTAEITVLSFEEVPADEVASSGFSGADDAAIYLVRAEATLTEVTELRIFAPAVDLVAMTADDQIATALPPEDAELFGCEDEADSSPEKGDSVEVCEVVQAPGGATVDRIQFAPYVGDYSVREGAPLTWR